MKICRRLFTARNVYGEEIPDAGVRDALAQSGLSGTFWYSARLARDYCWPEPRPAGMRGVRVGMTDVQLFNNEASFDFSDAISSRIAVILNAHKALDQSCPTLPRTIVGKLFDVRVTGCMAALQCLRGYSSRVWVSQSQVERSGSRVLPGEARWPCYSHHKVDADAEELAHVTLFNASQTAHPELFSEHQFRSFDCFFSEVKVCRAARNMMREFRVAQQLRAHIPWWGTRSEYAALGLELPPTAIGITVPDEHEEDVVEVFNPEQLGDPTLATRVSLQLYESVPPMLSMHTLIHTSKLLRAERGMQNRNARESKSQQGMEFTASYEPPITEPDA